MLCLILRLLRLWRAPTPPASTPAPDFVPDVELQYTNATYPHVIALFNRCYQLPATDPQDRVRPD
jgi:hypothetical protein